MKLFGKILFGSAVIVGGCFIAGYLIAKKENKSAIIEEIAKEIEEINSIANQ